MNNLLIKIKKMDRKWLISGLAILVIIGGFWFWNSHKKYNVADDINITFSGYDGNGTLSYNSERIGKKVFEVIAEKEGLKDEDIQRIESNDMDYSDMLDIYSKADKAYDLAKMVDISFSKTDNLKNGDKVKLIVKVPSKDIPIKDMEKEYTVKDLKKVKTISTNSLKSDLKVKFSGINGLGQVSVKSKSFKDMVLKVKKNGKLKNGDTAEITVTKESIDELNNKGKHFSGRRTFKVKVADLIDPNKITNLDNVINMNTEYAKENMEDDDTSVELLHTYIEVNDEYDYDSDNEVTVNQNSNNEQKFSVYGLYKITTTYDTSDPEISYETDGFSDLSIEDNSFNISEKDPDEDANSLTMNEDSLALIQQKLGSKALMIK